MFTTSTVNIQTLAFFCYPSIYLQHMLFNFLLSSHNSILWVQSVYVLSAAVLLSLPVMCRNSFPDRFVLPLWRLEKQQQESEHPDHQRSFHIFSMHLLPLSVISLHTDTLCLRVLENVFEASLHIASIWHM